MDLEEPWGETPGDVCGLKSLHSVARHPCSPENQEPSGLL